MSRKIKDDELDKLLTDELIKEAEMIEQSLLSGDEPEGEPMSKEELDKSYDKLIRRLKTEGVYHGDEYRTEAGETVEFPGLSARTEKTMPDGAASHGSDAADIHPARRARNTKAAAIWRKIGKVAGIALLCGISVLAGSMTSEANRKNFINVVKYLTGNDTKINVDNSGGVAEGQDESDAINEIENALGVEMPILWYRPSDFTFYDYVILENVKAGYIEYLYEGTVVALYVTDKDDIGSMDNTSLHGENEEETICIKEENILAILLKIQDENDIFPTYSAHWERDDCFYQLSGKIDKQEMVSIVENLKY